MDDVPADPPRIVVFSPHLDDAVLGVGGFMSATPCEVVTVFAGVPDPARPPSAYDLARGFGSSAEAMKARRDEDRAALETLGATAEHLWYLDSQYRPGRDAKELTELIEVIGARLSPEHHSLAPLGLGHPDHRWVARAARNACRVGEILLYEELPYRVLSPEEVPAQLAVVRAEGFVIDPLPWPPPNGYGNLDAKRRAIDRYHSQYPDGADPTVLVPERIWRCTR